MYIFRLLKFVDSKIHYLLGTNPNTKDVVLMAVFKRLLNQSDWRTFSIKLYVLILFLIGYFTMYHYLGQFMLLIASACLGFFSGSEDYTFIYYVSIYYLAIVYDALVTIYFLVQIEYFRSILRDLIGAQVFSDYIGDNPGSTWIASVKKISTFAGGLVGASAFLHSLKKEHDANLEIRGFAARAEHANETVRIHQLNGTQADSKTLDSIMLGPKIKDITASLKGPSIEGTLQTKTR